MSSITHIFLYLSLFGCFVFFQRYISLKKENRLITILTILIFTFIEGCRYARGEDYLHYKEMYEGILKSNESQLIFDFIIGFLHFIGLNYVGFFVFASFIFICATFYFINKSYHNEGNWMYLFAILAMLLNFECFVRQYMAMPLLFLGLTYMMKGGKKSYICALLTVLLILFVHTGLLFCLPFMILSYFCIKKVLPISLSLTVLFFAYYLLPKGFFSGTFVEAINQLMIITGGMSDNPMMGYVENSERWFGDESVLEGAAQSSFTMTLQFIFESCVFILGYYTLKIRSNHRVVFLYNIVVLGFVLCRLFHGYEIFQRLFGQLYVFWFVPVGYGFYVLLGLRGKRRLYLNYVALVMLIYLITFWGRFVFLNPDADYVWNH